MGPQKNHLNGTFFSTKTHIKIDGQENVHNFTLKIFANPDWSGSNHDRVAIISLVIKDLMIQDPIIR